MYDKPLDTILYPELSIANAQDDIKLAVEIFDKLINYSTHLIMRIFTSVKGDVNEDVAVPMLYLHLIEMGDAFEVLISNCCIGPAVLQLRSIFESLLYIHYILDDDSKYLQRSLSWTFFYGKKRLYNYSIFNKLSDKTKISINPDLYNEIKNKGENSMLNFLSRNQFQIIEEELKRIKKKNNKIKTKWYTLFPNAPKEFGPLSIQDLAKELSTEHLSYSDHYETCYRQWSEVSHGHDISRFIKRFSNNSVIKPILRNSDEITTIVSLSVSYFLYATFLVTEKYRNGENVSKWYFNSIKPLIKEYSL